LVSIVIVGVAGLFVALALAGVLLMTAGNGLTGFGQSVNLQPLESAGGTLSNWGAGILVFLALLAIAAVAILLRR